MGVLAPLGKCEKLCLLWWPVCDMRRVLMTQIGLVTIVLLAPAIIEDQKLIMKGLSIERRGRVSCENPWGNGRQK